MDFDLGDDDPPSIPACDDSCENGEEISRTVENPMSCASDDSKPGSPAKTDTSPAPNFRAPVRKSRRIEKQEKPKRQVVKKDSGDSLDESDNSPAPSGDSDDGSNSDSESGTTVYKTPGRKRKRSNVRREVTYKCTDCSEEFSDTSELANHRKNAHDSTELFKCHVCLKTLTTGHSLREHLRKQVCQTSDSEKIFKCFECGERFKSASELGNHRRDIHGAENNLYVCHICLHNCKYSHFLKPHIAGHLGARNFKCSKCGTGFKTRNSLKWHMRRVHKVLLLTNLNNVTSSSQDVLLCCRKCGMEFEDREKFIEHSTTEHGGTLVSCDHCDAVFLNKNHLKAHLLKHGEPKLKCQHCEKMFFNSSERNYHEKYSHNEASAASSKVDTNTPGTALPASGKFPCSQCPLAFDTETELTVHDACLHTEGPFKCGLCGQSCASESTLRWHELRYHGRLKCIHCREEVGRDAMEAHVAESHPQKLLAKKRLEETLEESEAEDGSEASDYAPFSSEDSDDDDANSDSESSRTDNKPPREKRRRYSARRKAAAYKCTDCSEEFPETQTFAKHRKDAHNAADIFKCHMCLKSFPHGHQLTKHLIRQNCRNSDSEKIFKCFECAERFKGGAELGNHRRDIHGADSNLYVCHICLFNCKYSNQLKPHILGHIGPRKFKCSKCEAAFKTNHNYKWHMLRVHKVLLVTNINQVLPSSENVLFRCRKCGMEFEEKERLIEHAGDKHGDFMFSCDRCNAIFWDKPRLNTHMLKHEDPKVKCQQCEKLFHTSEERRIHEKQVHEVATRRKVYREDPSEVPATTAAFQCSQCPMGFDTENELSVHVDCLHKEVDNFNCEHCEKVYHNKYSLIKHKREAHGILKCKYCCQEAERDAMTAHVAESHAEKLLPKKPKVPIVKREKKSEDDEIDYHCSDCNEILKDIRAFRIHRTTHGVGPEEIFKCYTCLKTFTDENFRLHVKSHNERTDWPCPHCPLRFSKRTYRNEHQTQVHGPQPDDDPNGMLPLPPAQTLQLIAGETDDLEDKKKKKKKKGVKKSKKIEPFKCVKCDMEFKRSLQLGNHRALVHGCPVEKRYQCHRCLKFCPSPNALHVHAMVHNDDTPHLCEVCGKAFKTKDYLLQHYRLMHTEDERQALKDKWKKYRMKKAAEKKGESGQD